MISHKINLIIATSLVVLLTHVDFYDAMNAEECNDTIVTFCGKYNEMKKCFEYLYFNKSYADLTDTDSLVKEFFEQFVKAIYDDVSLYHPEEYCIHHVTDNTGTCREKLKAVYYSKPFTKTSDQRQYSYLIFTFLYIKTGTKRMANEDTPTSTNSMVIPQTGKARRNYLICCKPTPTKDDCITTKEPADYKYDYMKYMFIQIISKLKIDVIKDIPTFCGDMITAEDPKSI